MSSLQRWELRRLSDGALMESWIVNPDVGLDWCPQPGMDLAAYEWRVFDGATGERRGTVSPAELPPAPRVFDEPPGLLLIARP